ncbi:MAG: MBL fold metallo-hydrolase [Planctomycetota bacterium]|nr:MBL fold metallo-hydrolase [Planctomycetota bacterium]
MTESIHYLDLDYMGVRGAIGAYLVSDGTSNILVEAGPGKTVPALERALDEHGLLIEDLHACCLTHIHLDHAGAAGHLARRGVPIHVHSFGAKHIIDPSKLLASAGRIYGDQMDTLWGEVIPSDESMVHGLDDGDVVTVGGIELTAIETPGHARHHLVFRFNSGSDVVCFTGDAAAMLIPGTGYVSVPMPPPEFDLSTWLSTIELLRSGPWSRLMLTHGGIIEEIDMHLDQLVDSMNRQVKCIKKGLAEGLATGELLDRYRDSLRDEATSLGASNSQFDDFVTTSLLGMNISGVERYLQLQSGEEN